MTRNLEDLMYYAVVERFTNLGVSMLSPLDDVVDIDGNSDLENLTKGVHSVESLEMVRSHLMQVLSGAAGSLTSQNGNPVRTDGESAAGRLQ